MANLDLTNIQAEDKDDIVELKQKITNVQLGRIDEERFKHYRLTRGVYGQRQLGVQMFRTKIPFGRLNSEQLRAIADASDKYSTGNLHLTTRQNIQLHYVKLNDSPHLWADLSRVKVTAMGACGNTVRNVTASAKAGVDPQELFDVTPYAHAVFRYFLRNPICQDMGRKIKIAFSATSKDSAFAYFHDFGLIPRVANRKRGFKVLLAGGLGAQSIVAQTVFEFLAADQLIPFIEAAVRIFDRYGERKKRMKARMKFLVKKWGVEKFMTLVNQEWKVLTHQRIPIKINKGEWQPQPPTTQANLQNTTAVNDKAYKEWHSTNVFEQKQKGYFGAFIKVRLGDISSEKARALAQIIKKYTADELRITINQGLLLKYIPQAHLTTVFNALYELDLVDAGFGTIVDITSCPGTDTCNLGVTNSTGLARKLEQVILENYSYLIRERGIQIKISGCMNSCGQHMAANIGFHGSSIRVNKEVLPAMQVVLGGGVDDRGQGFIAEKVIKIPTKRIPTTLAWILDDYENYQKDGEYFNDYVQRQGKRYFYNLLKPLADKKNVKASEFLDWGQDEKYKKAIGVGECAGVAFDMVATIIKDAKEKIALGAEALERELYGDSTYLSYSGFVIAAKAYLLSKDIKCNTHIRIINDFDEKIVEAGSFDFDGSFAEQVLQINKKEAAAEFAQRYWNEAATFVERIDNARQQDLVEDKEVLSNHYKA